MPISTIQKLAVIGTHLPRRCGIASFTSHVCDALLSAYPHLELSVVALNDDVAHYDYPQRVTLKIDAQRKQDYFQAANELNALHPQVVFLQHEYGIYGGPFGSYVMDLLNNLDSPVVTTLHTILSDPLPEQRRLLFEIAEASERIVTVSRIGSELLRSVYGIPPSKVVVIPHGIPEAAFLASRSVDAHSYDHIPFTLLSYGLLSLNKGFESVIRALPAIIQTIPNATYDIVGATHPNIIRNEGQKYRAFLKEVAEQCGVSSHVQFLDDFVTETKLLECIQSSDVCITPYRFAEQISSGTLSYFVGSGKPVISTPYWYAQELLAGGRGILVPFDSPKDIASAVCKLAVNATHRNQLRARSYMFSRHMIWPRVAHQYMGVFGDSLSMTSSRREPAATEHRHEVSLNDTYSRVLYMTDDVGMLQHAKYALPNYCEGYSTDDNARALIASVWLDLLKLSDHHDLDESVSRYLAFLWYAFNHQRGRFHNMLSFSRQWLDEVGSEECHGRAIWAAGVTTRHTMNRTFRAIADELLSLAAPAAIEFSSLRACAFCIFGIYEAFLAGTDNSELRSLLHTCSEKLMRSYYANRMPNWDWFESSLTYFNAKLSLAMLKSGSLLEDDAMTEIGLMSLDWLMRIQRPEGEHFAPIGCNGFFPRDGHRARFDQQPIDAYASISACLFAYELTGQEQWRENAVVAYSWFSGTNDLHLSLIDRRTSGCFDGLQEDRVNRNQGAESTLALLMSGLELEMAGLSR